MLIFCLMPNPLYKIEKGGLISHPSLSPESISVLIISEYIFAPLRYIHYWDNLTKDG